MIISDIKTHFPGKSYSNQDIAKVFEIEHQEIDELFKSSGKMNFSKTLLNEKFFLNLGVKKRNILCNPFNRDEWWKKNSGKDPFALEGAKAYEKLLKEKPPLSKRDRIIVISNTADTHAPHIGYALINHLKRRNKNFDYPSIISLHGEGCSGFISGLQEAQLYIQANPDSTVVVLTVEMMATPLMSPWMQPNIISYLKDKRSTKNQFDCYSILKGLAVQRFLFGDGCAAAYCTNEGNGIDFKNYYKWFNLDSEDINLLEVSGVGTKNLLQVSPFGYFSQKPEKLFSRLKDSYLPIAHSLIHNLNNKSNNYAIHTGSKKILEAVKCSLNLSDDDIEPSRNVLERHGNMNATTGAVILANLLKNAPNKKMIALFFGLGFSMQLAM